MAFALGGLACGASRPTGPGGYAVREEADGSVTIALDDGASPETMMAALLAAAQMTAWEPPETAPHLRRVEQTDLGGSSGVVYRYRMDHLEGRFDVYVYRHPGDVEAQIAETQSALAALIDEGRIESFAVARPQEAQEVAWNGQPAVLHRVVFGERVRGAATDSYMYLLKDDLFWIKVRASVPAERTTVADMDALVLGLLGVSP